MIGRGKKKSKKRKTPSPKPFKGYHILETRGYKNTLQCTFGPGGMSLKKKNEKVISQDLLAFVCLWYGGYVPSREER